MSSHVVAIVCWGLALAELMVPYSMKLLSLDMQSWLGLAMVGATTLSAGLFTCVFLLARRHGSRFSRPQASGYELACQDDLNQVWKKIVIMFFKKPKQFDEISQFFFWRFNSGLIKVNQKIAYSCLKWIFLGGFQYQVLNPNLETQVLTPQKYGLENKFWKTGFENLLLLLSIKKQ